MTREFASVCLVVLVLFAGCGKKASQPAPSQEPAATTAPSPPPRPAPVAANDDAPAPPPDSDAARIRKVEEAAAAKAAPVEAKPEDQTEMWMTTLTSMVADFSLSHKRAPTDLNELVALKLLPSVPPGPHGKKFSLDPKTHKVVLVDL